jgi:hypothetical protein
MLVNVIPGKDADVLELTLKWCGLRKLWRKTAKDEDEVRLLMKEMEEFREMLRLVARDLVDIDLKPTLHVILHTAAETMAFGDDRVTSTVQCEEAHGRFVIKPFQMESNHTLDHSLQKQIVSSWLMRSLVYHVAGNLDTDALMPRRLETGLVAHGPRIKVEELADIIKSSPKSLLHFTELSFLKSVMLCEPFSNH